MLIHLCPKFYTCAESGSNVTLADLTIHELGMTLRDGKEITTRRPFPNTRYAVACRSIGQKAMQGILIEAPQFLTTFVVTSRWDVRGTLVAEHQITYKVLDTEFDSITEAMGLWKSYVDDDNKVQPRRWPKSAESFTPARAQPRMSLTEDNRQGQIRDVVENGFILKRFETFEMHTVNSGRITRGSRMPPLPHAFSPLLNQA